MRAAHFTKMLIIVLFVCAIYGREIQAALNQLPSWLLVLGSAAFVFVSLSRLSNHLVWDYSRPISFYLLRGALVVSLFGVANWLTVAPVEWTHYAFHGPLALLFKAQFKESLTRVLVLCVVVGFLDEWVQGAAPGRVFDLRDILLNYYGAFLGLCLPPLLRPLLKNPL